LIQSIYQASNLNPFRRQFMEVELRKDVRRHQIGADIPDIQLCLLGLLV
jgi:hypothetical protein